MLILQQTKGEHIIITCPNGDEIIVKTCLLTNHYVKLGFDAPIEYHIIREEALHKEKKR